MLASTALMVVSLMLPNLVALWSTGLLRAGSIVGFVGLLGFGYLAHTQYLRAKAELAANPSLRGAWLVANAWWLVVVLVLGTSTLLALLYLWLWL